MPIISIPTIIIPGSFILELPPVRNVAPIIQEPPRVRLRFGLETRVGQLKASPRGNASGLACGISVTPAPADHAGLFRAALYH